jgi:hypothetical protein
LDRLGVERVVYRPLSLRLRAQWWQRVHLALVVWSRAASLDRELAAGVSPGASALLAIRAYMLTGRRGRVRVADGLARATRDAQTSGAGFSAAVRPDRRELLAARTVLDTLERRLRSPEPVSARGVALLRALLMDGASPLYRPEERGALGSLLRAAAAALDPEHSDDRVSAEEHLRQAA